MSRHAAVLERATDRDNDPLAVARVLADLWDERARRKDARGNGRAAVTLRTHAEELRSALTRTPTTS